MKLKTKIGTNLPLESPNITWNAHRIKEWIDARGKDKAIKGISRAGKQMFSIKNVNEKVEWALDYIKNE